MDKDLYNDGFEDYLKESADAFKLYPSDKVWDGINKRLHPARKWPYLAAALFLFGLGVGTGMMLEEEKLAKNPNDLDTRTATSGSVGAERDQKADLGIPDVLQSQPASKVNTTSAANTAVVLALTSPRSHPNASSAESRPATSRLASVDAPSNMAIQDDRNSGWLDPVTEIREKPELAKVLPLYPDRSSRLKLSNARKPELNDAKSGYLMQSLARLRRKTGMQLYFSPTVSYRTLVGQSSRSNFSYNSLPYSANFGFPSDVNDAVTHKPALGIELGSALNYPLNRHFRLKAGLQLNLNNYEIEAYRYTPEMAPFSANGPANFGQQINAVSYYRNFSGFSRTWLRNSHFMISMPLGIEMTLAGKRRVNLNVASTIQPTYVINNQSYLISTNLKNYAQEPSLYRKWNVNAGAEAYLTVNMKAYKWILGPQVRYQLLSSYKDKYPIREHLIDYGFKVGIQKTLK